MDVGTEVWVKCEETVWSPGVVLDCQAIHVTGLVKVKVATGDITTRRYLGDGDDLNEVFLRNKRRDFADLPCLIVLEYLHEPALLHALSERFARDRIYTSIGDILLAVNPFKELPLYSDAVINEYKRAMTASVAMQGSGGGGSTDGATDGSSPGAAAPHVFAIAGKAFSGLLRSDAKNQSILVSGESGSGKTESTKFLMKFLTSVGHDFSRAAAAVAAASTTIVQDPAAAGDINEIGKRILQTNPILESFGNARTIRNDNSSRFGKFIKIQFDACNQIVGAEIASYLLEKVRLIHQSAQERNFHIFYELLEGADEEMLASLGLERGGKYELLNSYGSPATGSGSASSNSRAMLAKRKSPLNAQYSKRFLETVQAFEDTGVEIHERTQIFRILGALLHLGNLNFEQITNTSGAPEEGAAVASKSLVHLEKCAELLDVSVAKLQSLLLTREITAGNDVVTLKLNAQQSKDASRSFAKAIYGRLFTWLVSRLSDGINYKEFLSPYEQNEIKTIGILDIFGFESLEENGFEQLCINYANERLQAQFNEFVFIKEQDIYVTQGIDWRSIAYPSNAACLALFDEKAHGLFSLLDQECIIPKGSNQALSTKYYRAHGGADFTENLLLQPQLSQRYTLPLLVTSFGRYLHNNNASASSAVDDNDNDKAISDRPFSASKMDRVSKQFVIRHFAGKVSYRVDQFLEKNQDSLPTDACCMLTTSQNEIVAMIGEQEEGGVEDAPDSTSSSSRTRARSKSRSSLLRTPSVSFQFRGQLDLLIDEIGHTEAHYIRCLKPNEDKKPRTFDRHRMVQQLRSVGVLEALRIARAGYSARLSHETFVDTFSCYRYKLARAAETSETMLAPPGLPDMCKALVAVLLDEANTSTSQAGTAAVAPPLVMRKLLKVDNAKFNDAVRAHGVQLGKSIVFCKTKAYNTFMRLRFQVRDHAARVLQKYGLGFLRRHQFAVKKQAALAIQSHVRRFQAMRFVGRIRALRKRVAAYRIQRCMRVALVKQREVDAMIRSHRLGRVFAHFQLGCSIVHQEVEELLAAARSIERIARSKKANKPRSLSDSEEDEQEQEQLEEEEEKDENDNKENEVEEQKEHALRRTSSRVKGIARSRSHEKVVITTKEAEKKKKKQKPPSPPPSRRPQLSSGEEEDQEKRDDQGEKDQSLRDEIERLQKLLGQQNQDAHAHAQPPQQPSSRGKSAASHRKPSSGRNGRSRVASLDVASSSSTSMTVEPSSGSRNRHRSRRAGSVIKSSEGVSEAEADDELDDTGGTHGAAPRRAQSVLLARDADHVSKLTRKIEELDAKCRQLERLVARPTQPPSFDVYPLHQQLPPRSGGSSSRRRDSFATSDGSNGGGAYPDNQSVGSGGNSGVENLIWSIQQQMDTLRQSVAYKQEEDTTAAIQARHGAHSMSFASSQPTRSSTVTSNGSSTHQPFDGPLQEDAEMEEYPSPSRIHSEMGYNRPYSSSYHGAMTPPTPASEASFRMGGAPRHPNGYPFAPAPPVVKWSRNTHCHECEDPFTLFVRRHHCRMCGNSFCHEHSSRRVTLLGMGFDDEPQRVCDACFAEYQAQASASPDYFPPAPTPTSMRGGGGGPSGPAMYRQRSFSQQYYPTSHQYPNHHQQHQHGQVPHTPQRYRQHQQPQHRSSSFYGAWAPPDRSTSSHTSAA